MTFLLNLMEATSENQLVPILISRIILNSLHAQIHDGEIVWLPKHQDQAMAKMATIRVDMIFDYVQKMVLSARVDANYFRELTQKHMASQKYHEAALIITKFQFHREFNCQCIQTLV